MKGIGINSGFLSSSVMYAPMYVCTYVHYELYIVCTYNALEIVGRENEDVVIGRSRNLWIHIHNAPWL